MVKLNTFGRPTLPQTTQHHDGQTYEGPINGQPRADFYSDWTNIYNSLTSANFQDLTGIKYR